MRGSEISSDFNPGISHPFYFIRSGLLNKIKKYSAELDGRLMDFGCGNRPYESLFTHVNEYIGVDYNETKDSSDSNNDNIIYYDGKTLPFSDEFFDSIFSSEVFEHVFNLDDILSELNRVLKPEGKILFTCPFVWNEHEVPYDFARYTQFALRSLLEANGFEVVESDKSGSFWLTLVQLFQLWFPIPTIIRRIPGFVLIIRSIINLIGIVIEFIIPKRYDLYLSNVVVAKKVLI